MANSPQDRRNRIGCFVVVAVLAFFVMLYMFVGFSAPPGNSATEEIQTVPTTAG
jgi:hypothetical protein